MKFALLTTVPRVGDATLERIAAAARIRLLDLAAAWSPIYSELATAPTVRVVSCVAELVDGEVPMSCVASLDDPNALAYHDVKDSEPYGLILADATQTLASIEQAAGHELLECLLDPTCDLYAGGIAVEACDPCQGDVMPVDIGTGAPVPFSPFVMPAYFGLGPGATCSDGRPLDPLGIRPGGYVIRADGSESFGAHFIAKPHRRHWHTRASRRNRALGRRIGLIR